MNRFTTNQNLRYSNLVWDTCQIRKFPELYTHFREEIDNGRDPYEVRDEIMAAHPEVDEFYKYKGASLKADNSMVVNNRKG